MSDRRIRAAELVGTVRADYSYALMRTLHELLSVKRDDVLEHWSQLVRGTLHPDAMPPAALVDHLPSFLDEITRSLARQASPDDSPTAIEHGVQRLGLGFALGAVVREYGVLRDAILAVARANDIALTVADYQIVFDSVITGIADAVSEYSRQRDAEVQRQASEHFAFVAHELRNPLQSVRLGFSILQTREELPPSSTAARVERGLTRMHDLIDHSLRDLRIGAGVDLQPQSVKLDEMLAEATEGALIDAESKGVRVSVRVAPDTACVLDRRLVTSAVSNLVRNAIKFTHDGGAVEVRGQCGAGRTTIEVEDECGGLPPGAVEEAFTPFAQFGSKKGGFGLGLAIAKQAADAHGGGLRIQNLPGRGCIFVLEVPDVSVQA